MKTIAKEDLLVIAHTCAKEYFGLQLSDVEKMRFYSLDKSFYDNDEWQFYNNDEKILKYLLNSHHCDSLLIKIATALLNQPEKETTFFDRLVKERDELSTKIDKLATFLESNRPVTIYQKSLLQLQLSTMKTYLSILNLRIDNLLSTR